MSEAPVKPKQTKAEKAHARRKELLDNEFRWDTFSRTAD